MDNSGGPAGPKGAPTRNGAPWRAEIEQNYNGLTRKGLSDGGEETKAQKLQKHKTTIMDNG